MSKRSKSRSSGRPGVRGTLIAPKILRQRATLIRTANAPQSIMSFSHKLPTSRDKMPRGVATVNSPMNRRRTSRGSTPTGHGINAPRGMWG